jgi:hypothetical protein
MFFKHFKIIKKKFGQNARKQNAMLLNFNIRVKSTAWVKKNAGVYH